MQKMLYSPISDEELSDKNRPCEKKEYHSKSSKLKRRHEDYRDVRDRRRYDDRSYRYRSEKRHRRDERESYRHRDRDKSRNSKRSRRSRSKKRKKSSHKKHRRVSPESSSSSSSSSDSEDEIKSTSFISEILRNKKTKNGEKILAEVIKSLSHDQSILSEDISYTPPIKGGMLKGDSKSEAVKPKVDENGNFLANTAKVAVPANNETPKDVNNNGTAEKNHKKKSVLELPMPPQIEPARHHSAIKHGERTRSISETQTSNILLSLPDIPLPHFGDIKENEPTSHRKSDDFKDNNAEGSHFKEIHSHLKSKNLIFTPSVKSTPPEYAIPTRPSVHKKTQATNNCYYNRSFESYKIIEMVGKGTYGKVYKSIDMKTNEIVAMKYIKLEKETEGFPITCLREIKILQQLDHPNVIKLRNIVFRKEEKGATYLIFDYMNHDLLGLRLNNEMKLDEQNIYYITRQILEGLNYCHQKRIIHRDLKLSNILVNNQGNVKICDFGLSRAWTENRPYTNKVISLWYRPIELLLGEEMYGPSIDIWSLGCIIVELFKRRPLFEFNTELEVINGIFQLCGTPEYNLWPEVKRLQKYKTFKPAPRMRVLNNSLFPALPPLAIDLVDKMLALNPEMRITAQNALKSKWVERMEKLEFRPLELPKVDSFEMRAKSLIHEQRK